MQTVNWADRQTLRGEGKGGKEGNGQTVRQLNWQMVVKYTKPTRRAQNRAQTDRQTDDGDRIEPLSLCVELSTYKLQFEGHSGIRHT